MLFDADGIVSEKLVKRTKRKLAQSIVFEIIRTDIGVYEAKQGKGKDIASVLKNHYPRRAF